MDEILFANRNLTKNKIVLFQAPPRSKGQWWYDFSEDGSKWFRKVPLINLSAKYATTLVKTNMLMHLFWKVQSNRVS